MKRAIAKCTKTEMPELDLPLFSSPYRAVQALLNGARDMESVNMARFQNLMKNVQSGNVPGAAQSSYIPIPVPVKQQQQTADPVDENMKLDLENMLDDVKSMNIRDKWLEDKTIEDIRTCYAVVQSLPQRFFAEMPLPEQYVKVKK